MNLIRLRRLESDARELAEFASGAGPGLVVSLRTEGLPPSVWRLVLRVPATVRLAEHGVFPGERRVGAFAIRDEHPLSFVLGDDYPFRPPTVTVDAPLFHPNFFPNGKLCWGIASSDATWWRGGDGPTIMIERLLRLLAGDPTTTNPKSPANREAARAYEAHAMDFPLAPFARTPAPRPRGGAIFRSLPS